MTATTINKSLFFDMDGVLVKYHAKDYIGRQPNYLKPGYFRNLEPNDEMVELLDYLHTYLQTGALHHSSSVRCHISVLSKVSTDSLVFLDQAASKQAWLNDTLRNQPVKSYFTGASKAHKAQAILGRPLTEYDMLIDDHNSNLEEWRANGGCAIKYGTGDRTTWSGYSIQDATTLEERITFITRLWDHITI